MARLLFAMLLSTFVTSCTAYWRSQTQGTSGPITWYVAEAKSESRPADDSSAYSFVLVLQETTGSTITFTTMTYSIDGGTGTVSAANEWVTQGSWVLPPRGTYRFPFTYTVNCPRLSDCVELGPPAPAYHITITGTYNRNTPIRVIIDLRLPPDPNAVPQHPR